MHRIIKKTQLAADICQFEVEAPLIAGSWKAGNFIIFRINEKGERIPLTIADSDEKKGTITIVVQGIGKTTKHLNSLKEGDIIQDIAGPLGMPTHIEHFGTAAVVGGGVGTAEVYPIAKALKEAGNTMYAIVGARNKELVIMEQELTTIGIDVKISTDDGSYGHHGVVTDIIKKMIGDGIKLDFVLAIGPLPMMKAVSELTKPLNIKTMVSLNSIMLDGTGMCGACRVTVSGKTKFVCVDGPEFDGHEVDYNELRIRQKMYLSDEKKSLDTFIHANGACQQGVLTSQ